MQKSNDFKTLRINLKMQAIRYSNCYQFFWLESRAEKKMEKIPESSSKGKKRQRDQEDSEPQIQSIDLDQTLSLGKYSVVFFFF